MYFKIFFFHFFLRWLDIVELSICKKWIRVNPEWLAVSITLSWDLQIMTHNSNLPTILIWYYGFTSSKPLWKSYYPTESIYQQKYQSHPKGIFHYSIFILTVWIQVRWGLSWRSIHLQMCKRVLLSRYRGERKIFQRLWHRATRCH